MLLRYSAGLLRHVSPRLLWKAARLWLLPSLATMRAYRARIENGELFPPFLFLSLTDACNLRCRGCWVDYPGSPRKLPFDTVMRIIDSAKKRGCRFFTLLGGEPLLYADLWRIPETHPDCYFQVITNGIFLDDDAVGRIRTLGNVTVLVSLDGGEVNNDARRGEGVFTQAVKGLRRLQRSGILFGVATTVTAANYDEVLGDAYVRFIRGLGAAYLWYYGYRPVGSDSAPELALNAAMFGRFRKRLLELRRRHPIVIIDTYWDADGNAICPAALGLGFHIGPAGGVEPCPPLSYAADFIDAGSDAFTTINGSRFLRQFQEFAAKRTRGCVILEYPGDLADFLEASEGRDTSGRNFLDELRASRPCPSHSTPASAIPEDSAVYRFLKRRLFFGLAAYG